MITTQSDGRPISEGFANTMASGLVEYDMKLWAGGAAVPCVVKSAKVSLGAGPVGDMSTGDFQIGQVLSTAFDAELYDAPDLMGEELEVRVGVKVSGTYEYVTVATVTVSTCREWKGVTTIQAAGSAGVALAAPAGLSDGTMAADDLAGAVGTAAGLSVALGEFASVAVDVAVDPSMTCRDALRALATSLGGFAAEDPSGGVLVEPFSATSLYELPAEFMVKAPDLQPEDCEADGLEVSDGERSWTYGTGRVKATVKGATAESSAVTWGNLGGYAYRPGTVHVALVDPRVTVLDTVSVVVGGDELLVPARGVSAKFDGGYFGSYSAAGLTAVQEAALVEGPVTRMAADAERVALEAQEVAEAVNQHFWHDSNGAHVTDRTQDEWLAEYAKPNHGELSSPTDAHPWYNQLMNSAGNLLRTGLVNLASWTRSAVAFFDGVGNGAENVVARFGVGGAQIGKDEDSHLALGSRSMALVDMDGSAYMEAVDMRGADGTLTVYKTFVVPVSYAPYMYTVELVEAIDTPTVEVNGDTVGVDKYAYHNTPDGCVVEMLVAFDEGDTLVVGVPTDTPYAKTYTLGTRTGAHGRMSAAIGADVTADGAASHAEGLRSAASGMASHAEGRAASASGDASHAEGTACEATGAASHAEGRNTDASGDASHAEGARCVASGEASHAEGNGCVASGNASHAQGQSTVAAASVQTALGRCNVEDTSGVYAVIVGNGTSESARSNALGVGWSGDVDVAGMVRAGGDVLATGEVKGAAVAVGAVPDTSWLSNATASNFFVARAGNTAALRIASVEIAQALPVGTNVTVGTLPSGCSAFRALNGILFDISAGASGVVGMVSVSGSNIIFRNVSGATIPAGTKFYGAVSYIVG